MTDTAKDKATSSNYDADNIFAKILDRRAPCFKVYESYYALAFLDLFPMTEGHTVLIPKLKGHEDLLSMPTDKAAKVLSEVQKVARAVKTAFSADGVNIWQNNGAAAGQTVFHPHFHIVPRKTDDGLKLTVPSQKTKLEDAAAAPLVEKIQNELTPAAPAVQLKKAKWIPISSLKPTSLGVNLKVMVLEEAKATTTKTGTFWEVLCGDNSGTVVISVHETQKDSLKVDTVVALRNAGAKMVSPDGSKSGFLRVVVGKWGKIEACDEALDGVVNTSKDSNKSAIEYELVDTGRR